MVCQVPSRDRTKCRAGPLFRVETITLVFKILNSGGKSLKKDLSLTFSVDLGFWGGLGVGAGLGLLVAFKCTSDLSGFNKNNMLFVSTRAH